MKTYCNGGAVALCNYHNADAVVVTNYPAMVPGVIKSHISPTLLSQNYHTRDNSFLKICLNEDAVD